MSLSLTLFNRMKSIHELKQGKDNENKEKQKNEIEIIKKKNFKTTK